MSRLSSSISAGLAGEGGTERAGAQSGLLCGEKRDRFVRPTKRPGSRGSFDARRSTPSSRAVCIQDDRTGGANTPAPRPSSPRTDHGPAADALPTRALAAIPSKHLHWQGPRRIGNNEPSRRQTNHDPPRRGENREKWKWRGVARRHRCLDTLRSHLRDRALVQLAAARGWRRLRTPHSPQSDGGKRA
jgi:hypothetical protein